MRQRPLACGLFGLVAISVLLTAAGCEGDTDSVDVVGPSTGGAAAGGAFPAGGTGGADPVTGCLPGQAACPEGCVDLASSPTSCGACGLACSGGQVCESGTCSGAGTGGVGGTAGATGGGADGGTGGATPPTCTEPDREICDNDIAQHCGYTYEFWRDSGGGCMTLKAGGNFSMSWGDGNNVLARKGIRPGTGREVVTYDADYSANGTSFLGLYGWTQNPLVEYYVVDAWGGGRPGSYGEHLGTLQSDTGTYDIYRTIRDNAPSIDGTRTFPQYWSVRTEQRTSGTITVSNHFAAWQGAGLQMGSLYEVSFVAEGYHSTGSADVRMSMR